MSLEEARAKMADFQLTFKARMKALEKRESAELQAAIDREVYALADAGMSVSAIAREYGTSDWNTIKKILDRRVTLPVAKQELTVANDNGVYTVSENGETVRFDVDDEFPYFHEGGNTALAKIIREDEAFLAKITGGN
jgi:hypothetical protein